MTPSLRFAVRTCCINPFTIDIYRRGEICSKASQFAHLFGGVCVPRRTIDSTLKFLTADPTVELAYAGLLVELDGDSALVIAEETRELRGQGIFLLWFA